MRGRQRKLFLVYGLVLDNKIETYQLAQSGLSSVDIHTNK